MNYNEFDAREIGKYEMSGSTEPSEYEMQLMAEWFGPNTIK
jgi:hypothetical protein